MSELSVFKNKVIDNRKKTMLESLNELLPLGKFLNIATGYFFLSGYQSIQELFNKIAISGVVKILIGNQTDVATAQEINCGIEMGKNMTPVNSLIDELQKIGGDVSKAIAAYNLRDLIALGKVKIKVYTGTAKYFHAKTYLIGREDFENDGYAIVGSSNFSHGGMSGNSELNVLTMDSYPSLYEWFNALWESNEVSDFSIDLMEIIQKKVKEPKYYVPIELEKKEGVPYFPDGLELRGYQKNAINEWFENDCTGTFKMATGSGKTITALALVREAYVKKKIKAVIVIVPYRHLVTQWNRESMKFNLKPILCYDSAKKWSSRLNSALYSLDSESVPFLSVIVTNSTFCSDSFQELLSYFPSSNTLIIGDEAHNLGSQMVSSLLPPSIPNRLALSATPERWFDEDGTGLIFEYFGGILVTFTLKDALDAGALVQYRYFPIFVELTESESKRYKDLTTQIARAMGNSNNYESDDSPAKKLLTERARLLASAQNKLPALRQLLQNQLDLKHFLVYVGDGTVEEPSDFVITKQIDSVIELIGGQLGIKVDKYIAETSLDERELLRVNFDSGVLQGIVAIRCLDEGVDIPSIQTAIIMASSSNPRQFVQRRGRVLRKHPLKKEAAIYDMIVIPPVDVVEASKAEKSLLNKEITRAIEFSELALNTGVVRGRLAELKSNYNLYI